MPVATRILPLACMGAVAALALAAPANAAEPPITFIRESAGTTTSDTSARVYTVRADGSGVKEVTHDPAPVDTFWTAWRPDHNLILFVGRPLETVRPNGTHRHKLPKFKRPSADSPTYRPDGKRIAFTTNNLKENTRYAIATIHPDGSHYKQLTKFSLNCQNPTYSPSGKSIAFERGGQIWRMHADGTHMKQVTHEFGGGALSPDWSPDGKRIAYVEPGALYTIRPDGSARKTLFAAGFTLVDSPAYAPDGKRIAFQLNSDIQTIKPDGHGLRQVTDPFADGAGGDSRPDW